MARHNSKPKGPIWPSWRYGPNGEKGIFECAEDVPVGWTAKVGVPEPVLEVAPTIILDKDALIAELTERGIEVNPLWGNAHMKRIIDGDISPTG